LIVKLNKYLTAPLRGCYWMYARWHMAHGVHLIATRSDKLPPPVIGQITG
jgi:hypothetical protein